MISVEKAYQVEEQVLIHDGKVLANDSAKAKSVGLKDDELILVTLPHRSGQRIGAPRVAGG